MCHADSLTVNQQRQRQTSVSQMTDGKDDTRSSTEMSVARRWAWSVVAECSTPALRPQEMHSHRELINRLTASALSEGRQSADSNEQQPLMSATGCQPDTPVLCCAHSGLPEQTARTGFTLGLIASAAPEAVESYAVMSDVSRQVKRRL